MNIDETGRAIEVLEASVGEALSSLPAGTDALPEAQALRDLSVRARKLTRAWSRPVCLGLFGPSQAGKSFLVGALLSHELGTLKVRARSGEHDFLREINPAKGVESTGVVTRFSTGAAPAPLVKHDFECRLLSLEGVLESLATGFLVECTSPATSGERIDRALEGARQQAGPAASPVYLEAWDAVWHDIGKKYQDRHPYLNELRRHAAFAGGAWKKDVKTVQGWLLIYSLLWGGPGYAPDLDALFRALVGGLDGVGHAPRVEVQLEHVRASSTGVSVIDAACLNSLGTAKSVVSVFAPDAGRDVAIEPGVLSALIAEVRLPLLPKPGSLLERADILDFPGGRALKGINGFGQAELSTGRLENAIEVYKRGKLTFLFEQYALDREITVLCLCSPGPTKPEAVQLQSQVESWLKIRHGAPVPSSPAEIERPSLFLALTKFDMSLGALRSDNAKDRWDSRVQEACIDFWARSQNSWLYHWGGKGRPFTNAFWIRNPYADQMQSLKPGEPDYETIKQGYIQSRAVERHIKDPKAEVGRGRGGRRGGLPKSGVPLLASALKEKLAEDVKVKELAAEAHHIREDLVSLLRALTPSKDEAEERARVRANAEALIAAIRREMTRRCSGSVFGELAPVARRPGGPPRGRGEEGLGAGRADVHQDERQGEEGARPRPAVVDNRGERPDAPIVARPPARARRHVHARGLRVQEATAHRRQRRLSVLLALDRGPVARGFHPRGEGRRRAPRPLRSRRAAYAASPGAPHLLRGPRRPRRGRDADRLGRRQFLGGERRQPQGRGRRDRLRGERALEEVVAHARRLLPREQGRQAERGRRRPAREEARQRALGGREEIHVGQPG